MSSKLLRSNLPSNHSAFINERSLFLKNKPCYSAMRQWPSYHKTNSPLVFQKYVVLGGISSSKLWLSTIVHTNPHKPRLLSKVILHAATCINETQLWTIPPNHVVEHEAYVVIHVTMPSPGFGKRCVPAAEARPQPFQLMGLVPGLIVPKSPSVGSVGVLLFIPRITCWVESKEVETLVFILSAMR